MSITTTASNTTAPTQFLGARNETYAYRRFGSGPGRPLLFLQHFTGTQLGSRGHGSPRLNARGHPVR